MLDFLAPYWNFLLVHPLISLLVGAYDLLHDFGFAIVFITIVIRLALYPLFRIQIQNQRAMQELAPAMSELKAKYGSDKQRLGQEQMKLYQERGYNPAMGCLPILLQMPLLLAMYQAFIQAPGLTGLTLGPDLLPFVPNPLGPDQKLDLTAYWLPWISEGLVNADPFHMLPAGLALYWVTTTLFGIVQQYFVSGWGQLPRFLPFLKNIPSPADRTLAARQQAALDEERRDMGAKLALANGPTEAIDPQRTREARRQRDRKRKK